MIHFVQSSLCVLGLFLLTVATPSDNTKSYPLESSLKATLHDPDNFATHGQAIYTSEDIVSKGVARATFAAAISGAAANQMLDVTINSTVIGTLKTDAPGVGTMSLKTLPPEFPSRVTFGDIVNVGKAKGPLINSEPIFDGESIATSSRDIGLILRR
jgi:hypothetical protein